MIRSRISSPARADLGARLAGVGFSGRLVPRAAPTSQAAAPAAPAGSSPAGAAFCHFTESLPGPTGRDETAPASNTPPAGAVIHSSNALLLPDHVMVLVRAVAAYERCSNERAVALALTEYATLIGAGALARAVADLDGDPTETPAHARQAPNRFRSGGP